MVFIMERDYQPGLETCDMIFTPDELYNTYFESFISSGVFSSFSL